MLAGSLGTIVALLALAWTREIVHGIVKSFGTDTASANAKVATISIATFFMYALDFAINTGKYRSLVSLQ